MDVKVKGSKTNNWGFVEKYRKYSYLGKGYIEAIVGVTFDKRMTEPYVFKGEEFIPLRDIIGTVGIDKYIKAKKPFYSLLKDGFLVKLVANVDFEEGKYISEKSTFEVFSLNSVVPSKEGTLKFKTLLEVPEPVKELMKDMLQVLGESMGDREKFLLARINMHKGEQ